MASIIPTALLDDLLDDFTLTGHSKLYTDVHVFDPSDDEGDFTEATFAGYSSENTSWQPIYLDGNTAKGQTDAEDFIHNGGDPDETIQGAYKCRSTAADDSLIQTDFASGFDMDSLNDRIVLQWQVTLANGTHA